MRNDRNNNMTSGYLFTRTTGGTGAVLNRRFDSVCQWPEKRLMWRGKEQLLIMWRFRMKWAEREETRCRRADTDCGSVSGTLTGDTRRPHAAAAVDAVTKARSHTQIGYRVPDARPAVDHREKELSVITMRQERGRRVGGGNRCERSGTT